MKGETYERLLRAFREKPGDCTHAARQAGTSWRTAKAALTAGKPPYRAIADLVEEEAQAHRAIAVDLKATLEAREAASLAQIRAFKKETLRECAATVRQTAEEVEARLADLRNRSELDCLESVEREVAVSRTLQGAVLTVGRLLERLSDGQIVKRLAEAVERALEAATADEALTPRSAMWLCGSLSRTVKDLAEASQRALELERVRLGNPTATVRHEHQRVEVEDTPENRRELVEDLGRLYRQLAPHSGLPVEAVPELPAPRDTETEESEPETVDPDSEVVETFGVRLR